MTREATYVLIGICVHLPLAAFLCSVPLGGGSRGGVFCVRGGPAQDCPGIPWHCVLCIQTSSPASEVGGSVVCSGRVEFRVWTRSISSLLFSLAFAGLWLDPLPLPVLGVSRGLQGQGQHPAKRTQLGGVLQKSFT